MSPFLLRKLRAMSTVLVIVLSLAVAAALAWWVHRYEIRRQPPPSPCSHILEAVFANGAGNTPDAELLARLLQHRTECMGDPAYVDQVRRLMLNTQQIGPARALLDDAGRRGVFTPDELKAEFAWIDLAASQQAWSSDQPAKAEELRSGAISAANELRLRWPEWPLPYLILGEAEQANHPAAPGAPATDYFQLGRSLRQRVLNGAWVRDLSDTQAVIFTFVTTALGMIAVCAGLSGLLAKREMTRLVTSQIATAQAGYVELKGTLHLLPGADAVIAPISNGRVAWYEVERVSGSKGARVTHERSAQAFVLRDATGDAIIDPHGASVHTRHVITKVGNSWAVASSKRVTERVLQEGDAVYVLGELVMGETAGGIHGRVLRPAADGPRLLISNFSEEELVWFEHVWFWVGATVFALAVLVLAWAYYQRYHVTIVPGVL